MSSILALDIGDKRIGVALADIDAPFPAPLTTLLASDQLVPILHKLLRQHRVVGLVVGLPRNQKGEKTAQTTHVASVVELLKIPSEVQLFWQDESLTSVKAEAELQKRKKPYSKEAIDALAATYILEDFIKSDQFTTIKRTKAIKPPTKQKEATKKPIPLKKLSKKKQWAVWAVIGILVALLALVSGLLIWYNDQLSARTNVDIYHVVQIKEGTGSADIAHQLESKQIIKNATAFLWYVKFNHVTNLQAGEYRISSKSSVKQVVDTIASGKVTNIDILIAPGLRLDQVIAVLEKAGYSKTAIEQALQSAHNDPFFTGMPQDTSLEGYLFPDTYRIAPDTSAQKVIQLILDNFHKQITPSITAGLAKQGLTLQQGIILASIVQKEVSDPSVQPTVAQVFEKRYREGVMLGSDVTYMYGAKITGQSATPQLDSPYNTRLYSGLPPGPIANFNISALKAVALPSATDYSFFVAGDDGKVHFSKTIEEHEALTHQYCTKACQ